MKQYTTKNTLKGQYGSILLKVQEIVGDLKNDEMAYIKDI
jgi:hypothetical protein